MTPAPLAARRLPLLACLLAVAAAVALTACGSDGAATGDETAVASQPEQQAAAPAPGQPCPAKLDAFASSLDRLRRQLAIGLSYEQYAAKVKALQAAYRKIPVGHLSIGCLTAIGTPSEQALNKYIDAANAWGDCLADATCATAAIEPVLQRKWRLASHSLSEAQ
jgi:hypothetical protein